MSELDKLKIIGPSPEARRKAMKEAGLNGVIQMLNAWIKQQQARIDELEGSHQMMLEDCQEQVAEIDRLNAALDVLQQTLLEVSHAQQCGADWYTKGASGLRQQVAMWVHKGQTAINSARNRGEKSE
jgi:uncharacterized protein YoxC